MIEGLRPNDIPEHVRMMAYTLAQAEKRTYYVLQLGHCFGIDWKVTDEVPIAYGYAAVVYYLGD